LKTVADPSETFIYARQQTDALTPSATNGTPRLSVLAIIEGAFPASAKAYNVREAIYKSELDAEITKIRIQAFKNPGRPGNVSIHPVEVSPGILAFWIATTKGDAAAPVPTYQYLTSQWNILALVAKMRSGEL
jgi:hypothetical protein